MFDSLSIEMEWGINLGIILSLIGVLTSAILFTWPKFFGWRQRKRGRWPVTVGITTVIGQWVQDGHILVNYTVNPTCLTWRLQQIPYVVRLKLIGEFSGKQIGLPERSEPYPRELADKEFAEDEEISIDRFRRLKFSYQITGGWARTKPKQVYLLIWVKYPPRKDEYFRTKSSSIIEVMP